ncbi:crosslink repair DNA glycosylase YcaQ family protein [Tersicoccus sp. MR15.9]|uniref:DNA glycosylase AlkZ-like family protein n=1 Tax=Tersicoccus mangrovi TaxID=3121635 RepID=UPI002FE5DFAA
MDDPLELDDLAALTLARQFPADPLEAPALLEAVGPVQTQTARSAFLGLAARSPLVTHASLTAAYEAGDVVRGSTLRGTVHTSTPAQHRVLDAVTRVGQRRFWERTLRRPDGSALPDGALDELWAATETFAATAWRTPDELHDHLAAWLDRHGGDPSRVADQAGRYLSFGHGGLLRRPLSGGWDRQGAPGYRAATAVTARPLPSQHQALDEAVLLHLRIHGPATREDIAWWSGVTLGAVDDAVARVGELLGDGLTARPGPGGRRYLDIAGVADAAAHPPAVRLLPEFDALFCGYAPRGRDRFVTAEHHALLWSAANGQVRPPLLVDGRITGWWRLTGSGRRRSLAVSWFARTRRPRVGELAEAVARVESALDVTVDAVTRTRV